MNYHIDGVELNLTLPVLPYAGTSGWSGTNTSRQRAIDGDSDGTTSNRQREAYKLLGENRYHGMTWRDLSNKTGWHHGNASGVLSVLHQSGVIVRLQESRNGSKVYVLAEYVDQRPISPAKQRGLTKSQLCKAILTIVNNGNSDGECIDQIMEIISEEMGKS